MKHKLLHYLTILALSLLTYNVAHAQYYESMGIKLGNPGGINKDSDVLFATLAPPPGATTLYTYNWAKDYALQYSPAQTIPFAFNFNGGAVSTYKVSTSGYITFSKTATTPVGSSNVALPTATLPDSSVCTWGMAGAAGGGKIYTMVYGTSPNQQLWIVFWFGGNPTDTNSQNVWAIVLEQTTNNIYLVDEWGDIGNAAGVYNPLHLTTGIQVNSSTAYSVPTSPSTVSYTWTNSNTENLYYEFSPTVSVAYTPYIKQPLFEEFNQASCDPCAQATPNLDSVMFNNYKNSNAIRYHVSWPGQDLMNQATNTPFVNTRVGFYAITGVPDAQLDGATYVYPGGIRSLEMQDEAYVGSPFNIVLSSATFDETSDTYSATATIMASHVMPANLVCRAALTVDTITYAKNQSTESIAQTVFPQVAENMFPGPAGTTLTAFSTVGSSQVVSLSWKKNHPWGDNNHTWTYDSTMNTHITVFVQDNNAPYYVYQSATVVPTIILGIDELSNVSNFNMYPNPASGETNIAFTLKQDKDVNLEVYNMLGEKVYSAEQGTMVTGNHMINVNTSSLHVGVYFVRFATTDGTITRKLVIQ